MEMLVDSDWAGDVQNRSRRRSDQKINNGDAIMRGAHFLKQSAMLQSSDGLSLAEAENYAVVCGVCFVF